MMEDPSINEVRMGLLDLIVIVLSAYALTALLADAFFHFDHQTAALLQVIDNVICIFFLLDFRIRFAKAESKLRFMKRG